MSNSEDRKPNRESVVFGSYELIERIAVGGMAEIYLAREIDSDSSEYLVVKRILPNFAVDRDLVDMFLDEQRVAAKMRHDNIVCTYDVGEVDGEYFISMEYLNGEDLRRIFRTMNKQNTLMPLDLALNIIIGAASGLHYAHDMKGIDRKPLNVVHRDVTPHNLVVTYDGVVKLVDFGVAKAANRRNSTQSGTIKGKIPYMSPEQCKGIELDRRSDIFALGIILYELTTGHRLYGVTGSEFATMRRIVEEPTLLPSDKIGDYPKELERIVLKALEKEPENRYQTALAMQQDLEEFVRAQELEISTEQVSRFMHQHFHKDILAWEDADGDITKLLDRLIAKHADDGGELDDLSEDELVFQLDEVSSTALRSQQASEESSGSKHIGNTMSLNSVWGAADPTAKSSRRRRAPSGLPFPNPAEDSAAEASDGRAATAGTAAQLSDSRPGSAGSDEMMDSGAVSIAARQNASSTGRTEAAAHPPRVTTGSVTTGSVTTGSVTTGSATTGSATTGRTTNGSASGVSRAPAVVTTATISGRVPRITTEPIPVAKPPSRQRGPWLWVGLVIAGMVIAFLLGTLL